MRCLAPGDGTVNDLPAPASWTAVAARGSLIVERLGGGVWRLSEAAVTPAERSFFYLLEGDDTDWLIDGGWGLCPGLDALPHRRGRKLASIATHSHCDHVGLLHLAGLRHAHAAEAAVFAAPDPVATQALPYLDGLALLPDGGSIDPASIVQNACPVDRLLEDGDSIDIGDRSLTVLHVPGHSPGSLAILDRRSGDLYCADTVHDGPIRDDIPGADRQALLASHQRLAGVEFVRALPGHGAILDRAAFLARIERYRRQAGAGGVPA